MKTPEERKKEALQFLKANIGGVIATQSAAKTPSAAFVYYVVDDAFNIYIGTFSESRKYQNIQADKHVAFTVAASNVPQTVQIEGAAEEVTSNKEVMSAAADLIKIVTSNKKYYSPQAKLAADWAGMKIIRITPSWIRWGDFTDGTGTGTFHQIDL